MSDARLLAAMLELRRRERGVLVEILAHLTEIEARKLHLRRGYSSMFAYCTIALGYSESAAGRRIAAARAARAFPALWEGLRSGEISLCVAAQAARSLTRENEGELLERLRGRSVRQAEEILAPWRPRETVRDQVRPLGQGTGGKRKELRYSIKFEASARFNAKLERVQALLSGKSPRRVGLEQALEAALDEYLERKDPQVRAERRRGKRKERTGKKERMPAGARPHIPAERRDEVWERDGGRCTYVGEDGRRCDSRWDVEVDHKVPLSRGGGDSAGELRLLCRPHNQLEAERILGPQAAARRRAKPP
jgi:5-methylcytosine-specific restriction endonuclease McrA